MDRVDWIVWGVCAAAALAAGLAVALGRFEDIAAGLRLERRIRVERDHVAAVRRDRCEHKGALDGVQQLLLPKRLCTDTFTTSAHEFRLSAALRQGFDAGSGQAKGPRAAGTNVIVLKAARPPQFRLNPSQPF